ncbi:MAG: CoA activase [Spirochaetes bacterium]|nr:CoA activase [Spirochaetota bacterium]
MQDSSSAQRLVLGVDVGSTTCKVVAVDAATREPVFRRYERHHTKQAEKVLELLEACRAECPQIDGAGTRVFITGSGATPLIAPLGAKFVQEVNAVAMAVEHLHPKAGSVVELGGQDAKVIVFKVNPETGEKLAVTAMNEKCASGTGATIDKCFLKVGAGPAETAAIRFDHTKLHHVAAKCGVFAETDIVNLVKTGVPVGEILNSLADAIVNQNLSVLTKGNTLGHEVILLGGPNTFLSFLQDCWRLRIPETWKERGYAYPEDVPLTELIKVPKNAEFYAAFGAVLYGMHEAGEVGLYRGTAPLREFISGGRSAQLKEKLGPPLVKNAEELAAFKAAYTLPKFQEASFRPGQVVRGYLGLDGGSTSSKCVLVDEEKNILLKEYVLSKGNPIQDMKEMLHSLKARVHEQGASLEILGFGATGYAAPVLEESVKADVNVIETVAHMRSSVAYFGDVDVICDIGGQDIKVLFMKNKELRHFRLSNQCSAGNGMILQAMADQFGVPVKEYAENAFRAPFAPSFNYGCAVFLDSDRVNFQKEGFGKEELMAGLAMVLPKNIWQYVVQIPRMAELGRRFVLQGGTQYNQAALKAQVDYIKERVPDAEVLLHPHAGEAGAIGAAFETLEVVKRRGYSTFIGIDHAIGLGYTTRNDEGTRCNFCPNHCSRTFIDIATPTGDKARYISGFSCDKGTVEDKAALIELQKKLQATLKANPNLVKYEAMRCFQPFWPVKPQPEAGSRVTDHIQKRNLFGKPVTRAVHRGFERSSEADAAHRKTVRIGMPKALNMWVTGPFFRAFFESLGLPSQNVIFSTDTDEKMSKEGMKYGAIDPCFPAKVAQAHIHQLLFKKHRSDAPLHYVYFPGITHVPSYLKKIMGETSCPIVQGTPNVMRTSFTREVDFFKQRGIEYVDDCLTFVEPNYLAKQLFEVWGPRLRATRDEVEFAVKEGFAALEAYENDLQEKGKAILEEVRANNRIAILVIGRPYHSDPGINHMIPEEFQALGFPILSMRSIPKDPKWLAEYFHDDLARPGVDSPLEINDVWPENFSTNSAQKVWAAKFAARHPNVAVLDFSSFKCGHDAPTYGIIDSIVNAAGTPFSALHDLDQTKPTGSIKIRIKTYVYNLHRRMEQMGDALGQPFVAPVPPRVDASVIQALIKEEAHGNNLFPAHAHRPAAHAAEKRPTLAG